MRNDCLRNLLIDGQELDAVQHERIVSQYCGAAVERRVRAAVIGCCGYVADCCEYMADCREYVADCFEYTTDCCECVSTAVEYSGNQSVKHKHFL